MVFPPPVTHDLDAAVRGKLRISQLYYLYLCRFFLSGEYVPVEQ